jgi:circadian clock protein KaiC
MDTWILLRDNEYGGERTRVMYILKSRGMAHSNQVREFVITDKGIDLVDVYVGAGTVYTGAARVVQEMKENAEAVAHVQESERLKKELDRNRLIMEAKITELRAEFDSREEELKNEILLREAKEKVLAVDRGIISKARKADVRK